MLLGYLFNILNNRGPLPVDSIYPFHNLIFPGTSRGIDDPFIQDNR